MQNLALMRLIDECHLRHPYYGSRRIRDWLQDQGQVVNRKRVQRLMGLVALYPKRNLSRRHQGHRVYPYLLRGLRYGRPMSSISRWPKAFCIWWRSSTGTRARCSRGDCRTRWMPISVSRHCKTPSQNMALLRSSTPTRAVSSPATRSLRY